MLLWDSSGKNMGIYRLVFGKYCKDIIRMKLDSGLVWCIYFDTLKIMNKIKTKIWISVNAIWRMRDNGADFSFKEMNLTDSIWSKRLRLI